ncbi:hydroxymethylglutaryl-CoA lyase [Dyadobacter psychrophilus]|uniref:Hydroxymethylglutaryl-CoA lyase n=1 Tax=Dyadobacter psychrophilus TaxID=651661 RepID=A0A1T5GWT0_9BACT|nr:hydroxymethylglutaryl-CoA lyase [Dyadobacter psychrophilus]SKC12912.1 hydroxymethylglutaryl-CoA lyase [Dyadobacter psychrophilus]
MKLIECPRDAWQGVHSFIPTKKKAAYINQLLKVGFDTIDFGSFVSPKAMPQVSDTAELIGQLDISDSSTKLLAIVANERGATDACQFTQITDIGYPFSVSETFQIRNANATMAESLERVKRIAAMVAENGKDLVIYISMGFGNPYGDAWNAEIVFDNVEKLSQFGIKTFSLADTVGVAREDDIRSVFSQLLALRPDLEFGAHFHSTPHSWLGKLSAAYEAGCRRFDGALFGYGGCPMAQDELVGNMATENLVAFAKEKKELLNLDLHALQNAREQFLQLI